MKAIFVTGTAGCGKSLLTSRLLRWYTDNDAYPISLNLDPGVGALPYEPDVDIRDFVDIDTISETYGLGPNGSLVMANDMIATRLDEVQLAVDQQNADYVVIDTPGQIELFAFRQSGPVIASNLRAEDKASIFVFDGALVSSPVNFVSISLLSASVALRLKTASLDVLSKTDLISERLADILEWASSSSALEEALSKERETEYSYLSAKLARALSGAGLAPGLIPVSGVTLGGLVELGAALARALNQGEDG
ncbi:MAG: ATP/GTP-binding protein [Nitrososphaera sp.]